MRIVVLLGVAAVALASPARAEIQQNVPETWPSKHELSAHVGYHLGFGAQIADASGPKLSVEYGYRFQRVMWFDVQLNQVFGVGARTGACVSDASKLCYGGGWSTQVAVGVKLKFTTKIPLVVEIPLLIGLTGLYNRECGDNAVAVPVVRVGAGLKYFIKPRIGIGAALNFDNGAAFHDASACKGGDRYNDYYGAVDFMIGAEFIL